jgi:hypothetical protein
LSPQVRDHALDRFSDRFGKSANVDCFHILILRHPRSQNNPSGWGRARKAAAGTAGGRGTGRPSRGARRSNGFTGVDDPYEAPLKPELVIDNSQCTPQQAAVMLVEVLEKAGKIPALTD